MNLRLTTLILCSSLTCLAACADDGNSESEGSSETSSGDGDGDLTGDGDGDPTGDGDGDATGDGDGDATGDGDGDASGDGDGDPSGDGDGDPSGDGDGDPSGDGDGDPTGDGDGDPGGMCGGASLDVCQGDPDSDAFFVDSISIEGDCLTLEVSFSGGCEDHSFTSCWDQTFQDTDPQGAVVWIDHESNNDPCEAILSDTWIVDLTPLRQASGMDSGELSLEVAGEQILYSF